MGFTDIWYFMIQIRNIVLCDLHTVWTREKSNFQATPAVIKADLNYSLRVITVYCVNGPIIFIQIKNFMDGFDGVLFYGMEYKDMPQKRHTVSLCCVVVVFNICWWLPGIPVPMVVNITSLIHVNRSLSNHKKHHTLINVFLMSVLCFALVPTVSNWIMIYYIVHFWLIWGRGRAVTDIVHMAVQDMVWMVSN